MKLYSHSNGANVHVAGIGFGAGSIYDPPGMVGMAHYVEHVICRMSRRHPDGRANDLLFRRLMWGPDMNINIRTSRENVFYGHGDLLRTRHMEEIFDVMASFVHPKTRIIDAEGMRVEAAAVHNEYYLRGIDWTEGLLDDLMHQTMYEKNPIRNRVDCEIEDLKRITQKDVERFIRRYYVPRNAFVIVLGPKAEYAKATAERYFRDWDEPRMPTLDYDHSDDFPKLSSVRSFETSRPGIHQYHCAIGFPTEPHTSDTSDAEALDIIKNILEVRLNWALREQNRDFGSGAYRTPVYAERSLVHGMFWATFATISGEFASRAEETILGEYERLKTDLVPSDEVQASVDAVHYQYLNTFWNSPTELCEMIIHAATNGDPDLKKLHASRALIQRVSRKQIRAVANKYFGENYTRVLIKPAT
jgi:predicted Zn-dependent peptidase